MAWQILLVETKFIQGEWAIPGGRHVEGEDLVDMLEREFSEEALGLSSFSDIICNNSIFNPWPSTNFNISETTIQNKC